MKRGSTLSVKRSSGPIVIYSPEYDFHLFGLERLHPFDGRKFSKAWQEAYRQIGEPLRRQTIRPTQPLAARDLLAVHSAAYLAQLQSARYIAEVLEFPILRSLPMGVIESRLLWPMRLAARGTLLAARAALGGDGLAFNLGGGYHHASADRGEGFCCFADISLAVALLRQTGELVTGQDTVMIIDLDAHQGNGHERLAVGDKDIYIFDMYNRAIYPQDQFARQRIDYDVGLPAGTDETIYLQQLKKHLPIALSAAGQPRLAFYIAGTDIYENDQLGGLGVSAEGIRARDRFVLATLVAAEVPVAVLTGGGYSGESYQHIANTVEYIFETWQP